MPKSDRGRFSAKRKREAVLRLLRGEDLDIVSREIGVTGATLATWRESFLEGGWERFAARPPTSVTSASKSSSGSSGRWSWRRSS